MFMDSPHLKKVGTFKDLIIYSVSESPLRGEIFVPDAGKIRYYMRYKEHKFIPISAFCQLEVWRDPWWAGPYSREGTLADIIFRHILFSKQDAIVSDKLQTAYGKKFWMRQIDWALDSNLCVYYLKVSGENTGKVIEIIRLRSPEDLDNYEAKIWGNDIKFRRIRVLITKTPVKFPPSVIYKDMKPEIE